MDDFPIGAPKPKSDDMVQIMMTEEMARAFEERCLGKHTAGDTELAGPLLFSEDDMPTYIIGLKEPIF